MPNDFNLPGVWSVDNLNLDMSLVGPAILFLFEQHKGRENISWSVC